jgi:hypothetical protein
MTVMVSPEQWAKKKGVDPESLCERLDLRLGYTTVYADGGEYDAR